MTTITETGYGMHATFDRTPDEVDAAIRTALADEGFGILSEIDVQGTLQKKLDVDPGPYTILGACDPHLANRAISSEADIGLLLPCNVVIRSDAAGATVLSIVDPNAMLDVAESDALGDIAAEAREKLERALAAVTTTLA